MLSEEMHGSFLHLLQIRLLLGDIDKFPLKNAGLFAAPDAVAIGLAAGIQSGMKSVRYLPAGVYAHILGQIPPQLGQNLFAGHIVLAMKACHLPQRVRAGIGPAAAGNLNGLTEDAAERCFQLALHRIVRIAETLPALVAAAVIA